MAHLTGLRRYGGSAIDFTDKLVLLTADEDGAEFRLHYKVAASSSDLIKRRLANEPDSEVKISTTKPPLNAYVNWLYSGILCTKITEGISRFDDLEDFILAELYILGLCLEDETFTSLVAEAFLTKMGDSGHPVRFPGSVTLSDDVGPAFAVDDHEKLVSLVVEAYVRHGSESDIEQLGAGFDLRSNGVWKELGLKLSELRRKPIAAIWDCDVCRFHAHGPDSECKVEKESRKRRRVE